MISSRWRSPALTAILALAVGGEALSQSRTKLYQFVQHGFEIRVPRWLEVVPPRPGDQQTLIKFSGARESTTKPWKADSLDLELLVVRIPKRAEGPTTGPKPVDTEDEIEIRSVSEMREDLLNRSGNLAEYLQYRGYQGSLVANEEFAKHTPTDKDGRAYLAHDIPASNAEGAVIRALVHETDLEIFGVIALGIGLNPFIRDVVGVVESIRQIDAATAADGEDPYADSELRGLDRRRAVRAELAPGWSAYDTDNFILVTNVTLQKLLDATLVDLEVMREAYHARFPPAEGADMEAVSTVRLCDGYDDYLKFAGKHMDGTGGYWNFREQELVLFNPERRIPKARPWVGEVDPTKVLYHEAMHQYFHYSNRALAPASWFNEGYGEVFGGAEVDRRRGEVRDIEKNAWRLKFIRADQKKKLDPPQLSSMLKMTQGEFYSRDPLRNYAYSWAFCFFLEHQRGLTDRSKTRREEWANLADRYLAELRKATETRRAKLPAEAPDDWISNFQDEIQKEAITAALEGLDLAELQDAYATFVRKL